MTNVMTKPDLEHCTTSKGDYITPGCRVAYLVPAVMSVDASQKITVQLEQARLRVGVVKRMYERHAAWGDFDGLYVMEAENGDRCNLDEVVLLNDSGKLLTHDEAKLAAEILNASGYMHFPAVRKLKDKLCS